MDVVMPQLGETVSEGTISVWHKKVGDAVRTDQPLFEVETDKVTMDIPAPVAGVLAEIVVQAGETVQVGARLAVIQTVMDEDHAAASPTTARDPTASVTATGWPVASATGSAIARADETLNPTASSSPTTRARPPASAGSAGVPSPGRDGKLSPVVRKLLAEHHIDDLSAITGTGADGRITRDDVLAYVERRRGAAPPAQDADTVIAMTRIRKLTAEHMVRSVATSPHVLQAMEVDFLEVERLRSAVGDAWRAREGFSLSYLPFVARAVCQAVPEFPHVNASVRGDSLVVHHRVNLGIAVDLDRQGLIVPVVKDASSKTVRELAIAIHRLADRARRGALAPDDLTEGSYTISNPGPFGTLITAPIIYQPQVAILSTDGVKKRPVVIERPEGDAIEVRPVGVLAQCFDHRAFDGAYSAAFLRRLKEILEQGNFAAELA